MLIPTEGVSRPFTVVTPSMIWQGVTNFVHVHLQNMSPAQHDRYGLSTSRDCSVPLNSRLLAADVGTKDHVKKRLAFGDEGRDSGGISHRQSYINGSLDLPMRRQIHN